MSTRHFTDFDEYAKAVRNVDVDVCLVHPHTHQHIWSLEQLELLSVRLQFAVEGSGILAFGKMHRDGWGLYAQLSGAAVCVNGTRIGPGAIAVLPPDSEFRFAGQGAVCWFSVFAPGHLLVGDAELRRRTSSVYVLRAHSQLFNRLHSQARKIQKCATRLGLLSLCSPDFELLQDDLLSTMGGILREDDESSLSVSTANARRLVAKAVELIHDCHDPKVSVCKLAVILDVSERTLQYVFRNQFDVSPQAFLINHRLHQARKCLQRSDPEQTTVATIAADNGFFDFGRFAAKYLQRFGELPSVTLRRPK